MIRVLELISMCVVGKSMRVFVIVLDIVFIGHDTDVSNVNRLDMVLNVLAVPRYLNVSS